MLSDVCLWFARNQSGKYTTIFEINESNKNDTYICPVCLSKVIAKGIGKSSLVSSHFAHVDASKCNTESLMHWCYKNNFLIEGSSFSIVDREAGKTISYICDSVDVEKMIDIDGFKYRPDITVNTTTGEKIFFEINYKNHKKVEDYINIWLYLNCTVVEIDIKPLLNLNSNETDFVFNPIFMNGKSCCEISKNKSLIESKIKLKELIFQNGYTNPKDFVNKIDWFWNDLSNYKLEKCDINGLHISLDYLIQNLEVKENKFLFEIINKFKCGSFITEYNQFKKVLVAQKLDDLFKDPVISRWYTYQFKEIYNNNRL